MPTPSRIADRYALHERLAALPGCSAHRATDLRLERPVTVAILDETGPCSGATFHARARDLARSSDEHGLEVYDGAARWLVVGALGPVRARVLLDRLSPPAERAAHERSSTVAVMAAEQTRPAVGLAATSALLLVLAGLLSIPGGSQTGAAHAEGVPAVMGVPDAGGSFDEVADHVPGLTVEVSDLAGDEEGPDDGEPAPASAAPAPATVDRPPEAPGRDPEPHDEPAPAPRDRGPSASAPASAGDRASAGPPAHASSSPVAADNGSGNGTINANAKGNGNGSGSGDDNGQGRGR